MRDRQRSRFNWPKVFAWSLAAAWVGGGLFLHLHNRLDVLAALTVLCLVVVTAVAVASAVICRSIRSSLEATRDPQERLRRLEAEADNVVPIRPTDVDGPTVAIPLVAVGRAHPIAAAVRQPGRPRLSFTAGDHTIDCALRDELEGETG